VKQAVVRIATLFAGLFASAFSTAAQATPDAALRVELMVFSGRENPSFRIDDAREVAAILQTASTLPRNPALKETERPLPPSRLGYQGFLIINDSAIVPALKSFIVYGPAVQLAFEPPGAGAHRTDAGMELEQRLLAHAQRHKLLDEAMLDMIRQAR
jgi:hypothetical protein